MADMKQFILKNGDHISIKDETARNNIQTLSESKINKPSTNGTTGQVLIKKSNSDNDVGWGDMPNVPIEKITVNGVEQPISNKTVALTINQSQITQSSLLTLTVVGWDSTTKQQTVALTVDTEKRNVIDITVGELPLWSEYNVYAISESATGITFKCNTIPEEALTFRVTSMGVN